jgi:hypothetical protein
MKGRLTVTVVGVLLGLAAPAHADLTLSSTAPIEVLNLGGNGMHGAYVKLVGFSFTGCSSEVAFIEGANPNYKEFIASLLAAKLAEKEVQMVYSGCINGYPVIREVSIR